MVRYVLQNHNADPGRVFVTGLSSGAMMTNVLLGAYPDVFRAGAAFAGVPFACFATADDTLRYPNFGEEIKQWTNVLGVSETPALTDNPRPGWTRTRYGGTGGMAPVEAVSIQNGSHNILMAGVAADAIRFFGLNGPPPTSPPPVGDPGCLVTDDVSAWNTGLVSNITITNTAGTPVNGWSLVFTLPSGQTITSAWNASYVTASGQVAASNLGYNATIGPAQSTTIGFQATHTGNTGKPASFVLNGTTCATG